MCDVFRVMRTRTAQYIALAFLIIWAAYVILLYNLSSAEPASVPNQPTSTVPTQPTPTIPTDYVKFTTPRTPISRIVHIDLKGSPPNLEYLHKLIFDLSKAGVTGIMIEYDDMFPYERELSHIAAAKSFSKDDLYEIIRLCESIHMEVIPMVQTLGRWEHILKLHGYRYLREDFEDNRAACPTNPKVKFFVMEMIKQIMDVHFTSKRIHIGCDEVAQLKVCPSCVDRKETPIEIFFDHVKMVTTFIRKWSGNRVTPLMWDNMLRLETIEFLKSSNISRFVKIVVQDTNAPISKSVRGIIWRKYTSVFETLWVAGAYKGADGPFSLFPDMENRFANQDSWLDFLHTNMNNLNTTIEGYILAGSSKVDHFASSIDLLPVSKPSLILNALRLRSSLQPKEKHDYLQEYSEILKCDPVISPIDMFNTTVLLERCNFEESPLIEFTLQYHQMQLEADSLHKIICESNTYATEFHKELNFTSSRHLYPIFNEYRVLDFLPDFSYVYSNLYTALKHFFPEIMVEEWMAQHGEMVKKKVFAMHDLFMAAILADEQTFYPRYYKMTK